MWLSPASASGLSQRGSHSGAWLGSSLCQKPLVLGAVREAVHVQRAPAQVGQHDGRDLRRVAQEIAFGHRRLAVAAREQHLVEVGDPQLAAEDRPGAGRCAARRARRARPRRPQRPRWRAAGSRRAPPAGRERHSRSGSAFTSSLVRPREHRLRMVLGVPARRRRSRRACAAAATPPCPSRRCRVRTSTNRPRSFSPCRSTCSSPFGAARGRGRRSRRPCPAPTCPASQTMTSPPPYSPAGITPSKSKYSIGWSSTWNAARRTFGSSVGPFGTAQLTSTPSDLQPEVVVQPAGPVPLHDEATLVRRVAGPCRPGGFRRAGEVPLAPVRREPVGRRRRLPSGRRPPSGHGSSQPRAVDQRQAGVSGPRRPRP